MKTSNKQKEGLFRRILPQLLLLSFIGILFAFSHLGLIPMSADLNNLLVEKFKIYGLPLIAGCAFVENLVGVNTWFPGAFTILTGMALTAGNPERAVITYFTIYLPSYIANLISYYLGYTQKMDKNSEPKKRSALLWFFLTYCHPQLASLTAFSVGSEAIQTPKQFVKFSFFSSFFWSVVWALIIYHFGLFANVSQNFVTIFVGYVLIWTALDICKWNKGRRNALK